MAELVQSGIDVIVATTSVNVAAAKKVTACVPIVMSFPGDPVAAGFVASLARPGGNISGLTADGR